VGSAGNQVHGAGSTVGAARLSAQLPPQPTLLKLLGQFSHFVASGPVFFVQLTQP